MKKQIEQSSASNVANADDIELQEVMENAAKSTEDLIVQFETALQAQVQFEKLYPCSDSSVWTNSSETLGAQSR